MPQATGTLTINAAGGTNTLQLGNGLTPAQLTYATSGNDLLITDGTNGDLIDILSHGVQTLAYAGRNIEPGNLGATVLASPSTPNIYGTQWNDTLIGGTGTENLNGNGGNDTFIGGSGAEIFYGGSTFSGDLFVAGQGSTTVYSGSGNNTYSYASGDGTLDNQ